MRQINLVTSCAGLLGLMACGNANPTVTASAPAPTAATPPAAARRDTAAAEAPRALAPARVKALTQNFDTWYGYAYYNVPLFRVFTPLGVTGQPLTKKAFLQQLLSGKVLALLNGTAHGQPVYQLYAYGGNSRIKETSQQLAEQELRYVGQEGRPLPAFQLTDLRGTRYTALTTRGKVLVLKTWFVRCGACVQEFPEVNELVDRYRNNKEVVFVSLALDDATSLQAFLKSHPLRYAVVPGSGAYIQGKLRLQSYPTHLVVGRDGRITYMTNSPAYLAPAIDAALHPGQALAAR